MFGDFPQEFFGQLDQRILNAFLKACDELTDILPEQEQQSLQETVRKLHKHWKVGPRQALMNGAIMIKTETYYIIKTHFHLFPHDA